MKEISPREAAALLAGQGKAAQNNIMVSEKVLHTPDWPCAFGSEVSGKKKQTFFSITFIPKVFLWVLWGGYKRQSSQRDQRPTNINPKGYQFGYTQVRQKSLAKFFNSMSNVLTLCCHFLWHLNQFISLNRSWCFAAVTGNYVCLFHSVRKK